MLGDALPSLYSVQANSHLRQPTQRVGSATTSPSACSVIMRGAAEASRVSKNPQAVMPAIAAPVSLRNWRREKHFPPGSTRDRTCSSMRSASFRGFMALLFLNRGATLARGLMVAYHLQKIDSSSNRVKQA